MTSHAKTPTPQTDAARLLDKLEHEERRIDELAAATRSLLLSAKDKQADAGVDVTDYLADMTVEELENLRFRLIDELSGGPLPDDASDDDISRVDGSALARFLVELVQHEIAGRWVKS